MNTKLTRAFRRHYSAVYEQGFMRDNPTNSDSSEAYSTSLRAETRLTVSRAPYNTKAVRDRQGPKCSGQIHDFRSKNLPYADTLLEEVLVNNSKDCSANKMI